MKKTIYILTIFLILIIALIIVPNVSKAATVSVGKVNGLTEVSVGTSTINLKWNKVKNATGYRIYILNSETNKFEYYGYSKTNSFEMSKLKSATEYTIRVRAYITKNNKKYFGKYSSNIIASTRPRQVKNIVMDSKTDNNICVSWDKVPRATGYRIYLYNLETEKFEYYGYSKTNSFEMSNLKSASEYKIRIRAYITKNDKKLFGKYSLETTISTNPKQVKNIVVDSRTDTSIKISWDKVVRATGYRIYLYNTETDKFEYYGYSKTNSFEINNLESAMLYKIRIRAYKTMDGIKNYGKYSKETSLNTNPSKVNNIYIKENTADNLTLKWDKVERASGYRVYTYDTQSNSWTYYKTIENNSIKIQKSDVNTTKFRVRAFIKVDDANYYGKYSNVISIRKGIDVSEFQRDIDWEKVKKDGVEFAVIRCGGRYYGKTAGQIYEDSTFETNIKGAKEQGLDVAIYFFSGAITEEEAIEEANWCINKLKECKMENECKYIVYDFEVYKKGRAEDLSKDQLNANTIAFMDTVSKAKYTPILYGNINYLTNYFDLTKINEKIKGYKIWLANYVPEGENTSYDGIFDMWQYTSSGTVDGINGVLDLDIIYF